jgi:subtilisin family serine protease
MTRQHRSLRLALLIVLLAPGLLGADLSPQQRARLHPAFRPLVEEVLSAPAVLARAGEERHDAIIYVDNPAVLRELGITVNSVVADFVTAQVTAAQIAQLASLPSVRWIDPGTEHYPVLDLSLHEVGAASLHGGYVNGIPYKGEGAIVLIYDTGIDWSHMDFRDPSNPSKTRIVAIWDQTLTAVAGEAPPSGFPYGVEYTKAQIDNEVDGTPAGVVRERDINGHGTHVAGTAAGNGLASGGKYVGLAPLADIIVVKGGDGSFSSSREVDGLTYAENKAAALGKPIVVNMSIGGQSGPHDGTSPAEVKMDEFSATPGRVVAVSAGNDGAMPIHISGTINAGAFTDILLVVPTYSPAAGTENDDFTFEAWFNGTPNLTATVTSPTGITYTRLAGETGDGPNSADGRIRLWNYTSSQNMDQSVYLRVYDATAETPRSGTWNLRITNNAATGQEFDAWLSDRSIGGATVTLNAGNTAMTVAMPGTSNEAITVGSWVSKWLWPSYTGGLYSYPGTDRTANISSFSSLGPTRDGRMKPEVSAPGQGIIAALSTHSDTTGDAVYIAPGQLHFLTQGTSMAAPHVTGAAALVVGAKPTLTAAQVKSLFSATANSDALTGTVPNNTWGYGKLDVLEALARALNPAATITQTVLAYDQPGSSGQSALAGVLKDAVRFSPPVSGRLSAIRFNVTTNANGLTGTGNLVCEVYTDAGGFPGTRIGTSVLCPIPMLTRGTNNFVSLLGANASVTAGTDYHIVLSAPGAGDTVRLRSDQFTATGRSSRWDGSAWTALTVNKRIWSIILTGTGVSDVESVAGVPETFALAQNYPNPFNPSTTVSFSLPVRSLVNVRVYNILGQEVETLVSAAQPAGNYTVRWTPAGIASGTYICRLEASPVDGGETFVAARKILYLK